MKRILGTAALLLTGASSVSAHADLLNWAPQIGYAQGVKPVAGVGTTQFGAWEIEVHQATAGMSSLVYSSGRATGTGLPVAGRPTPFDVGVAPAVSAFNTNPDAPSVVEVHQGQTGAGPLWFSIGSMANLWTPATITWTSPAQYDWGFAPSVASLGGAVVEVHQGQAGPGSLWYRVGSASGSTIAWSANAYQYEWGAAPAVAIANTPNGTLVIEVHQAGAGMGTLWFRTGTINGDQIAWSSSAPYDQGVAPQLAVYQDRVVEVHQGSAGAGTLWYHLGAVTGTNQSYATPSSGLAWDASAHPYGTGYAPSVSFDATSIQGYELHQGSSAAGSLLAQIFSTKPVVPLYPQLESNWCWLTAAEMTMEAISGGAKDDGRMNGQAGASALECQAMNLRQQNEPKKWGANGQFIDCCANVTWNDASGCDRPGDYVNALNDRHYTHTDYAVSVRFGVMQSELAAGRPIPFGVAWNAPSGGGHALVVAGTEVDQSGGQWVVINDPGGVQWINSYAFFANRDHNVGPWIVTEMSTNVKAP